MSKNIFNNKYAKIIYSQNGEDGIIKNVFHIHESGKYEGSGFRPTFNLGKKKGYKFILHTGNMIFIREELFDKLNINYTNELENFRTNWIERRR